MMAQYLTEPERRIPLAGEADVIIAGAGPSGMAAALAAARSGAKVRLFEAHGCLGGVWTAGMLAWMFEMDQPGIPREISRRLDQRGARVGGRDPNMYTYDIEEMKRLLEEMCEEENIAFQLHTRVAAALVETGALTHVLTESKSGRQAWGAKCFVDATGDGDLAALASCGYDLGKDASGACQPMTYMALVALRDTREAGAYICFWEGGEQHRYETVNYDAVRALRSEIERAGVEPSYSQTKLFQVRDNLMALMVNHQYGASAIDAADLTRATVEGRNEIHKVVHGLQKLGGVWSGFNLVATCEQIGVREGRRIHGRYTVTQDDLAEGRRHPDGVCTVHFGVDVHSTDGTKSKGQDTSKPKIKSKPYDIPMRALIARDVDGLLLAGRCISGDFIAHSSYRVTGTAAATGQAAGVAAALSAQQQIPPGDLPWPEIRAGLQMLKNASQSK